MKNVSFNLRSANPQDLEEIQTLFVETIKEICCANYSPEQIQMWTSAVNNKNRWVEAIEQQYFIIAEFNQKIVGFASLENYNFLDFLYVHKHYQRQGIAIRIYNIMEKEAKRHDATSIYSEVSITAKPFFEKLGFRTIAKQTKVIGQIKIINFKMSKKLV